jgi:SAM-dependent methyltransferase
VKRVLTPPSTNYHLVDADLDPLALLPRGSILVDLGGGSARGQYAVTRTTAASKELRVLTVDLVRGASVDVQGDAHAIPLQSASVDGVFCVSVLEYVASPQAVVGEIHRVLKPGGIVYLSAPFVFPYHPPPDDRFRFSMAGLKALTAQFDPVKVGFNRGPASTFCHVLVHFVAVALSFGSAKIYGVLLDVSKWCLFWIKFLDRWIGRYPSAQVLHGSAYVLALKPKRQ